jgi:glycosyltransferase involved in cell wall biosynthesis
MKILHTVESYLPARHGMQEVVTQLSEKLVSMGHQVTVATSFDENRKSTIINGVTIASFKIKGNFVTGITGETERYQEFLKSGEFDIITNFAAQQWATDLMLPILNEISAKKVFVPTGFSAFSVPAYRVYYEKMKTWMKEYDSNIFLANNYRDINFAKSNYVKAIQIIPNGANEVEFENTPFIDIRKLTGVAPDALLILTVGNHTGFKGHAEAMKIFSEAAVDNSILLIIGNNVTNNIPIINLAKELISIIGIKKTNCSINCKIRAAKFNSLSGNRSIIVKEFDRSNTINAFKQADLFLFPSLIECSPIVLFEALTGTTPFLVSDVGNSQEIIEWTGGGKLLPTHIDKNGFSRVKIKESAKMLKMMLENEPARKSLATAGHTAVLKNFTWSKIASQYEDLYLKILRKD